MTDDRTCRVCGRPLVRVSRDAEQVEHGRLGVLVEGADVLACPEGHQREEVVADLADRLVAAAREELLAARSGRLRRRARCGACGTDLTVPGRRTVRSVSTAVPGLGVVRLTLDLPLLRCPGCGREQLPAEVARDDLAGAVGAALDQPGVAT